MSVRGEVKDSEYDRDTAMEREGIEEKNIQGKSSPQAVAEGSGQTISQLVEKNKGRQFEREQTKVGCRYSKRTTRKIRIEK